MVLGLAKSGLAVIEFLLHKGNQVIATDIKDKDKLGEVYNRLECLPIELIVGGHPDHILQNVDEIVVSPGVPNDLPILQSAKSQKIPVISEIELAYRYFSGRIVGITGTNGKTTTTALTGDIFINAGYKTIVAGNIGVPFIESVEKDFEIAVLELSSFQLEEIKEFKPEVGCILNITPDHLNRHKTMENYINTKFRISENQRGSETLVLNYDDGIVKNYSGSLNNSIVFFSRKNALDKGVYVKDRWITIDGEIPIIPVDEIFIRGNHNLENALASTAIAHIMGVDSNAIASTLRSFKGVEHRLEQFATIGGRFFINDSKGTNPDASIKAIEAMDKNTILIAGGIDKGADFTEFVQSFDGKVKALVLLGETANYIKETAEGLNFNNIFMVNSLEEAVKISFKISKDGDTILLSPACASWDMFKDFEERGTLFKEYVKALE